MKRAIQAATTLLAAMAFFGTPALAASSDTEDFVRKASIGNEFEIQSSQLALDRSSQKKVKEFARTMVADHTALGDKLKKTLATAKLDITATQTLDDDHQEMMKDLKSASAADFDKKYMEDQENAHDDAVELFEDYAEDGDNADLKKLASDALPQLRKHQEMAHNLNKTSLSAR